MHALFHCYSSLDVSNEPREGPADIRLSEAKRDEGKYASRQSKPTLSYRTGLLPRPISLFRLPSPSRSSPLTSATSTPVRHSAIPHLPILPVRRASAGVQSYFTRCPVLPAERARSSRQTGDVSFCVYVTRVRLHRDGKKDQDCLIP